MSRMEVKRSGYDHVEYMVSLVFNTMFGTYSTELHTPPNSVHFVNSYSSLHRLEVVSLLNLGLSLLAHRPLEFFSFLCGLNVMINTLVLLSEDVDRLVLDGDLGS